MIYYPLIHSNIYYLKKPINFQSRLCLINKKVKINNEIYQPNQKQLKMRLSKDNYQKNVSLLSSHLFKSSQEKTDNAEVTGWTTLEELTRRIG